MASSSPVKPGCWRCGSRRLKAGTRSCVRHPRGRRPKQPGVPWVTGDPRRPEDLSSHNLEVLLRAIESRQRIARRAGL
jgi:hypothetical protein